MAVFKQSDMVFDDYSWTAMKGDDPKVSGPPDSTLFNRHEGYEVLYLINKVLEAKGLTSAASGQRMERMIRDELPGNVRGQLNVKDWIDENW